jgi:hypothetical protein
MTITRWIKPAAGFDGRRASSIPPVAGVVGLDVDVVHVDCVGFTDSMRTYEF